MEQLKLETLILKYPNAFNDSFYFECGNGWYNIIEPIVEAISKHNTENQDEEDLINIDQVKEKYGTLRFYTNHAPLVIRDLITKSEAESEKTCEVCGEPGILFPNRWYYTACLDHTRPIDKDDYFVKLEVR